MTPAPNGAVNVPTMIAPIAGRLRAPSDDAATAPPMGAVISLCLAGAVALAPSADWAAFVVLPQLFWLLPLGWAITATVVFAPGLPALAAAAAITAQHPGTCVVVLSTYDTDADILRAVEAGAAGYPYKDCSQAELTSAIRAAARGETVLTPSVAARLVSRMRGPQLDSLSPREVEVLGLVAIGRTNAEIGRELPIAEATVKTHLLRAFTKLDVSDRTAAVTVARSRGLLS